ncbi:hypothetical protein B7H23_01025 [Notoacmeibacter marinus]|uniref:Nucleotide-diphospho-sugar transferase domain-containing protein n=1 Tax=Notoacmeibacter marinus TaxID=1876515 RepID=A0A231V050_9HYPH|nr:DUF6492 family protein [Notoacmeibacter marinus]OXT01589.1 hypothetical protein B7H23_01025 [Notoacmeibacter marinus]
MTEAERAAPGHDHSVALVTASYAGDMERFRLLCETLDRHAQGYSRHLVLVSGRDAALFRPFEGPRRHIVNENELLPEWLHDMPDPFNLGGRRLWLSWRGWPLRGWHIQQLRKIAIARHVDEHALVFLDSDVAFVKAFDARTVVRSDGSVRLFRRPFELVRRPPSEQHVWSRNAGRILGLGSTTSPHDYIATLIAWRTASVRAMIERIENACSRHWVEALARQRAFSECMIYGRFSDEFDDRTHHFHDDTEWCHTYWGGPGLTEGGIRDFLDAMGESQVAVALQSFTGSDIGDLRRVIG